MNPQLLALLQQYGIFGSGQPQPTVPVMPTPSPAGLLDMVGAMPNQGGMNAPIPAPTAAPLPADPAAPQPSFQQRYAPMFQAAAGILNHQSAPAPRPQPFLHPLFWHSQGGGY